MSIIKRVWWIKFYPSYTYNKKRSNRLETMKLLATISALSMTSNGDSYLN